MTGSSVIYKDNFAVVTGSLSGPAGGNGEYQGDINYPDGFNQDNCVVISCSLDLENSATIWGSGATFDSSSFIGGALPTYVCLQENIIKIEIRNIRIDSTAKVFSLPLEATINYKIVLMKI